MVTDLTFRNAYVSQRTIYDERYEVGRYDRRSAVHVLTAERRALRHAANRALESNLSTRTISLFDFGYGTGRVSNEFIGSYVNQYSKSGKDLWIVAYDVSSTGLMKAKEVLCSKGFTQDGSIAWKPEETAGYIAGRVSKRKASVTITVVFVHGNEDQHPEVMRRLALEANGGRKYLLTTSWYSGLGHIPGEKLRREYFHQLSKLTARRGEMVISVSSRGDLAELQPKFSERLANGITDGFPIQAPGDLVYETELGQSNFYHVFGTDLNNHMRAITGLGQHWWVEGIRYPDEEFTSREAERANYRRVLKANQSKRDRIWDSADYREFHTVAAFRSRRAPNTRYRLSYIPSWLAEYRKTGWVATARSHAHLVGRLAEPWRRTHPLGPRATRRAE
jgi:hypothetical protein